MNILEQKIDAICRVLLADTEQTRNNAKWELFNLLNEPAEKPDGETTICDTLKNLGIPCNLLGHAYLSSAIEKAIDDPALIKSVTKPDGLYALVAQDFGTAPSRVERAMRHAIEVAFDRGDPDVLQQYFGNTVSGTRGKTTNTEFISSVCKQIRLTTKN